MMKLIGFFIICMILFLTSDIAKASEFYLYNNDFSFCEEDLSECEEKSSYFFPYFQADGKAERILNEVSRKFRNTESMQADFSLTISMGTEVTEKQDGKVYLKGNKYRIETKEMDRVSDNKSIWTIFKDVKEIQINEFDPEEGELSPVQLFTLYEKDYSFEIKDEFVQKGTNFTDIDLIPNDKSSSFFKVRLTVNNAKNLITKAVIFDRNGSRYTYELENFDTSGSLSDNLFVVDEDEYENDDFEIIDLR